MARQFSSTDSTKSSPEGFWHLPGDTPRRTGVKNPRGKLSNVLEGEHGIPFNFNLETVQPNDSPTWIVPKERNSRKKKGGKSYFYDATEEDLCFLYGGEVTTKNKFSVLKDTSNSEKREFTKGSNKKEDTSVSEVPPNFEYLVLPNFEYFMNNIILQYPLNVNVNEYNLSMYNNKSNVFRIFP